MDRTSIERLIVNTVTMLCKNSIQYTAELRVQALIGLTVDQSEKLIIQVDQRFGPGEGEDLPDDSAAYSDAGEGDGRSLPAVKRPRMTSTVPVVRRAVGRSAGLIGIRRPRTVMTSVGAGQRVRQQLAFPSPNKPGRPPLVQRRPGQPGFGSVPRQAAPSSHTVNAQMPEVLHSQPTTPRITKVDPELMMSGGAATVRAPAHHSSDVICVESDDETAPGQAPAANRKRRATPIKTEVEVARCDALQAIYEDALLKARASNPLFSSIAPAMTSDGGSPLPPAGSPACSRRTPAPVSSPGGDGNFGDVGYAAGCGSSMHYDVKPVLAGSAVQPGPLAVMPWTPSKPAVSRPPAAPGTPQTPQHIKTEKSTDDVLCSSSLAHLIRTPSRSPRQPTPYPTSPACSSPLVKPGSPRLGTCSPRVGGVPGPTSSPGSNWATEMSFICKTDGCDRRFTTKRALVHHQKTLHAVGGAPPQRASFSTGRAIEYADDDGGSEGF